MRCLQNLSPCTWLAVRSSGYSHVALLAHVLAAACTKWVPEEKKRRSARPLAKPATRHTHCWADVRRFAPCLSSVDIASSALPLFVEFRAEYEQLRSQRDEIAAFYATLEGEAAEYFDFDGTFKTKFHPSGLPLAKRLPADVSSFSALSSDSKPPAMRELRSICSHAAWKALMGDCIAVDAANAAAGMRSVSRESARLVSTGAEYSGAWLQTSPLSWRQRSSKVVVGLQRRFGLYISSAASLFDALEAEGEFISASERLGDSLHACMDAPCYYQNRMHAPASAHALCSCS